MAPTDASTSTEADDNTQEITIQGLTFTAGVPYKEGSVLTANEAVALNQTYAENLGNNFRNRIKKAQASALAALTSAWDARKKAAEADGQEFSEAEPKEASISEADKKNLQDAWDEYVSTYEFNGRRPARQQGDPIMREARKLAKATITAKLKEGSYDTKSVTEEKWDELITNFLAKFPSTMEQARIRVEASKAVVDADMSDFKL